MNQRKGEFHRRFRPCATLTDSEGLVAPEEFSAGDLPAEIACVTESLSFGQLRFAPSELLSLEFVLHENHSSAECHNQVIAREYQVNFGENNYIFLQ
jgi:hypothetical protein